MKRTLALVAVLVAALTVSPTALAGGHAKGKTHKKPHHAKAAKAKARGRNKFQLNGTVVSLDTTATDGAAGSLTVTVKTGTKTVRAYRGQELTVLVAQNARFVDATPDADDTTATADASGATTTDPVTPPALTLVDLVAGARVHLGGVIDRTGPAHPVLIARKVILQRLPDTAPPEPAPPGSAPPEPTEMP